MIPSENRIVVEILFLPYILKSSMAKISNRLVSLDIFRGMTIAFMIIVNTPGSWKYVYSPLKHSEWHGCTPTDLVFPFFLFIVGMSTYFSLKKYGNEINSSSIFRIFRRMIAIFAFGLFLTIFPYFSRDYSTLRIMGVLQRIALAYGIGAIICLATRKEYFWIVTAVLLLIYWSLLAFFGGADPYSLNDNFALKADLAILGKSHMYKGFGIPFEPEGLLSTIPSICTVIIGYFIGDLVARGSANGKTVLKLFLIGAGATGLGYLWGLVFPINKALWTSSYVLYSAGLAMIVLSVIYLIADVLKFKMGGTFFVVFGTNALFTFAMAGIWTKLMLYVLKIPSGGEKISFYNWFYEKICVPVAGNLNGSLMFAVIQVLLLWSVVFILYRKKIMIRL
jgi:predicted acyltransferase